MSLQKLSVPPLPASHKTAVVLALLALLAAAVAAAAVAAARACCCSCCCCCCSCCSRVQMVLLGCGQLWCVTSFAAPAVPPTHTHTHTHKHTHTLACQLLCCSDLLCMRKQFNSALFSPYVFLPLISPLPLSLPLMRANAPVHNSFAPAVSPRPT